MGRRARRYHHGSLKSAMIEAALTLVRKKGPRGFTLNEASRIAGVSVSAPYNHFEGKDGLLVEIVMLGNRTLEAELRAAAESDLPPKERLLAVFLAYIAFAEGHPELFAVMFQSGIDKAPYPDVQASSAAAFEVATTLAGQVEDSRKAAEELALAIWTMAHGFATLNMDGALARVSSGRAAPSAEALARRLLYAEPFRP